nr:N-acetylneuraminate synthase family protein [Acidobacteriota bacterium]
HSNGISISVVAYMLGSRIIEKHFTLNHTWKGTDHALSLEPIGMQKMVRDLQRARVAVGDGTKRPLPIEAGALTKMGKKLVAARSLPVGHVLEEADIAIKSPGDGLAPTELTRVIGRRLLRALDPDASIALEALETSAVGVKV